MQGKQIQASRTQQDFSVRLTFDQALPKGQPVNVTFFYDGKLTGQEDSPVYGVKFAAIHPDFAYLMYPARWFPVSGYTTDRFGADMRVTVPMGYSVLGSGIDTHQTGGDKTAVRLSSSSKPSFPGSIAVVKEQPAQGAVRRRDDVAVLPRRRGRYGAAVRAGDRQDHVVLHGRLRHPAVRESDGGRDRRRRARTATPRRA